MRAGGLASNMATAVRLPVAPEESAKAAGLRHVDPDTMPGLRRVRRGAGFVYLDAGGFEQALTGTTAIVFWSFVSLVAVLLARSLRWERRTAV